MLTVQTSKALLLDSDAILKKIASFWDDISLAWENIWGTHIHHGYYYDADCKIPNDKFHNTPQEKLIEKIIETLKLERKQTVLDVGCGLGGSAIYLAKHYQANVVGVSLSTKQIEIARKKAAQEKVNNLSFFMANAHELKEFSDKSFDVVWSLESCEQFYDKALFIEQAYRVLKPGGKLMIATWCADKENYKGLLASRYIKLCKDFDLPYMPTITFYEKILQQKFIVEYSADWSLSVKKSWSLGIGKLKKFSWFKLFKLAGLKGLRFAKSLKDMNEAFKSGQLRYAVFIAVKK